ncbi:MAG: MerC domain-containing protein [Bacteroidota bacterium]
MDRFLLNADTLNNKSDLFGAASSALCMIHCIITPFVFIAQSCSMSCCASKPLWWSMIDYIFLAVSFVAIRHSAKHTSLAWIAPLLYVSWGLLTFFIINERLLLVSLPSQLMYVPAFGLVFLHIYNRRHVQCLDTDCCPS